MRRRKEGRKGMEVGGKKGLGSVMAVVGVARACPHCRYTIE
jgi:hypothetical protein